MWRNPLIKDKIQELIDGKGPDTPAPSPGRLDFSTPQLGLDFVSALADGGKALIVGGSRKAYAEDLRTHPQFVVWDDPSDSLRQIPSNARIVVVGREVSHKITNGLKSQLRRRHIYSPTGLYTPSQINTAFRTFMEKTNPPLTPIETITVAPPAVAPPIVTEPVPELAPVVSGNSTTQRHELPEPSPVVAPVAELPPLPWSGSLRDFVQTYLDRAARPRLKEYLRLVALAETRGIYTSVGSISRTAWHIERQLACLPGWVPVVAKRTLNQPKGTAMDFERIEQTLADFEDRIRKVREEVSSLRNNSQLQTILTTFAGDTSETTTSSLTRSSLDSLRRRSQSAAAFVRTTPLKGGGHARRSTSEMEHAVQQLLTARGAMTVRQMAPLLGYKNHSGGSLYKVLKSLKRKHRVSVHNGLYSSAVNGSTHEGVTSRGTARKRRAQTKIADLCNSVESLVKKGVTDSNAIAKHLGYSHRTSIDRAVRLLVAEKRVQRTDDHALTVS